MRIWPHKRDSVAKALSVIVLGLWAVAATAAEFELRDLDGKLHRLSDYRGKWVVVNFWATWCPPCREEIPELIFFHDSHKDKDAVVIGVNYEDLEIDKVRSFLEDYLVSFPVLLSEPDEMGPLGRIKGLPTTYLVAPDGKVVHERLGAVNVEYLEGLLERFKGRSSP